METIVYVRPERYGWTSSYRTYEEWKREIAEKQEEIDKSSYRTYEEWKHS